MHLLKDILTNIIPYLMMVMFLLLQDKLAEEIKDLLEIQKILPGTDLQFHFGLI